MTWQPISTAPRVRFIPPHWILATDCDSVEIIRWCPHDAGEWVDRQGYGYHPSFWQPLPDVPELPINC